MPDSTSCLWCDVIGLTRADERRVLVAEGWVPAEQHDAIVATAKVRVLLAAQSEEREKIARAIEAMERVTTHGAGDHALYTVWQDEAAALARRGGEPDGSSI